MTHGGSRWTTGEWQRYGVRPPGSEKVRSDKGGRSERDIHITSGRFFKHNTSVVIVFLK